MTTPLFVLGGVLAAHLLASISPGPNVLLVMHTAIGAGRQAGICAALGVATGAAIWSLGALFGLTLLFTRFEGLAGVLRVAGASYLVLLGVRLWRGAARDAFAAAPGLSNGAARAFGRGLMTNLLNPKALLFYASVFAALLAPALPLWVKLAAVAIVVLDSAAWHVALACLFSTPRAQRAYRDAKPAIDRCAGAALGGLGVWLGWV